MKYRKAKTPVSGKHEGKPRRARAAAKAAPRPAAKVRIQHSPGGLRGRWLMNSLSFVVVILAAVVIAVTMGFSSYYYNSIHDMLSYRMSALTTNFYNSGWLGSLEDYYYGMEKTIGDFDIDMRDKIELQFLSEQGTIMKSSSGLNDGTMAVTGDVERALGRMEGESQGAEQEGVIQVWTGEDPMTGERVLSMTTPLYIDDNHLVGAIRMVTSLNRCDLQVAKIVAVALVVGAAIVLLVSFSNLYFVRSIVEPVTAVTETAKRIAAGSYGIQMEKKYDDEVGDLTDAINDMSLKIDQSEKMKSEFISSVSHELRTPLTAINGWAETIMNGEVRDAADVKKGMGIIVSEARRLTNMVEELLEFSRIEDGRFTLSVEPMDIKAELEDAVYTYTEFFRREGITLTHTDCEEEFPPIPGDPERMRQVFCNLLDNAAKHGGSGKRIDTAIRGEEDAVVITIRDYGPGIPEDELPHVKYKFYKGSSKARGSGIGLAVCEEIITRHNGRLDIGNAEGGGCIVTIRLPMNG